MKSSRSQSAKAGSSSSKKAHQEHETGLFSRESIGRRQDEPILSSGEEAGEEEELSPSASLCHGNLRAKGPAVTGLEETLLAEERWRELQQSLQLSGSMGP